MITVEEAERLLAWERPVILITNNEGIPDARAISAVRHDGIRSIWMITGKSSDKYRELSKDHHCLIYATDFDDTADYLELRLYGTVELLDDEVSRNFAWRDEYACYFSGGKIDPNLGIIKFLTKSVTMQTKTDKITLPIESCCLKP